MPRYTTPKRKRVVVPKLKPRVRVKAWRRPNEDNPSWTEGMARAIARDKMVFRKIGRDYADVMGELLWPSM